MPPVDRNRPVRAKSSDSRMSFMEFVRDFPDDAACLDYLWRTRYSADGETAHCPKCDKTRTFKQYATKQRRQSWTCTGCGHHIHPTAGTIFHKSSTSLHLWFYAIYLVSSSKCGIAAKQLEREIGVNYKTALRMLHLIRQDLMEQGDDPLSGEVEVDETYLGGRVRASETRGMTRGEAIRLGMSKRPIIFAAVERGGKVRARIIPNSQAQTLIPATREYVLPGSMIFTDDWQPYRSLHRFGYTHRRINHSARIYVDGNVHTQTIDGFFGHFKTDVRGTHHSISTRWLPGYLNEWVWKWNHRDDDAAMFRSLLRNAASQTNY